MIQAFVRSVDDATLSMTDSWEPTQTVADIRHQWSECFKVPLSNFVVQNSNRETLPDDCRLGTIQTCAKDVKIVILLVKHALPLSFQVYPGANRPVSLHFLLSQSPEELLPHLKNHFHIRPDREVRFMTKEGSVLEMDTSLETQGVMADATITIELQMQIHVRNEWQPDREAFLFSCFPKDPLPELSPPRYLRLEGFRLQPCASISEVLPLLPAVEEDIWMDLCEERGLHVLTAHGLQCHPINTESTLVNLDLGSTQSTCACAAKPQEKNKSSSLILHETTPLLPALSGFKDLEVGTLVLADLISFKLDFGKSGCRIVRLSGRAKVGDLLERAASLMQTRDVALFYREEHLTNLDMNLSDLGITGSSAVKVEKKPPLVVSMKTLSGRRTKLVVPPNVYRLSYSNLRVFHEAQEAQERRTKRSIVAFRCDGCKRHIVPEEEDFQTVPSNCCKKKSLSLTAVILQGKSLLI